MRPTKLILNNFGPFIHEVIDFEQINKEQLFLISGKTGSGKTMLFDGIVYALFGKASTEGRNEGELRSHFADGKSPMSVEYEFKINDKKFKISRQAGFIKEGNTSLTPGKLDVFEFDEESQLYELRESKISSGNGFIKDLLGINAEQFRQLFILPQGEFKKFLVSNSSDKQSILRTLFNSIRFEEMQNLLLNQVKDEKKQIESRYSRIQILWEDIETFENDELIQFKSLNSMQTKDIIKAIPQFELVGQHLNEEYEQLKSEHNDALEAIKRKIEENNKLIESLKELDRNKDKKVQLEKNKDSIEKLKAELRKIIEIKPLSQLYNQRNTKEQKYENTKVKLNSILEELNELNVKLEKFKKEKEILNEQLEDINIKSEYIDKTKQFYSNINKYREAFNEIKQNETYLKENNQKQEENKNLIDKLNNDIAKIDVNNENIDEITQEIFQLTNTFDKKVTLRENKKKYQSLSQKYNETENSIKKTKEQISDLKLQLENIDKSNIDLNDKQTFIQEIQNALHVGDTCPICGNEIESLNEHIKFDEIAKNQNLIKEVNNQLNKKINELTKLETTSDYISNQMSELEINDDEISDINEIEQQLRTKNKEKEKLQIQIKQREKLKSALDKHKDIKHSLQIKHEKLLSLKHQFETLINEFKSYTNYDETNKFEQCFKQYEQIVTDYVSKSEVLEKEINQTKQQIEIETNNLNNNKLAIKELEQEISGHSDEINQEMKRIGLNSYKDVEILLSKLENKEQIEMKIQQYEHDHQKLTLEIERLSKLTKDNKSESVEKLEATKTEIESNYNKYVEASATIQYQVQKNKDKFNSIMDHINYLEKELKEQQEIFELSEVLSGKNSKKLTLENYVLIYYLERIIHQANIRLERMSGERYQLKRRESISHGYSGLEIEVFDFHSNKSRHISSLSGGETFQASLALALGLSEVVQQESGGITLESMFIDEGFGTLDQETLETALDTLVKLKTSGRMVGIISHVSELKQRIPLILEVTSNQYQSHTRFKWN
ncbi:MULTISPECIES: exonuclease subunit SbcC [Staphylococcus]|uniref:exonuclease subunit SbcC n=1 Tax=Staphylococcus TaxID=1279 RepID=UPI00031502A8|nr:MULTISPECIES: exonuclease subunit SbcC [Staphylococcus]MBC3101750.1 SMC family ATPase [Staphylococcus haemolyticus]MBC3142607.1 SMC family ATPase [Staphylococcus haemolyticus]MBO0385423.1 SMC family ATPase [Staphylococcus haemolyticus]MCC2086361.1 SMC family ATPase [Staphylococcus haemolyticus]MCH4333048.1 SMC family ATPase [Staphylococcus haemolyticus]